MSNPLIRSRLTVRSKNKSVSASTSETRLRVGKKTEMMTSTLVLIACGGESRLQRHVTDLIRDILEYTVYSIRYTVYSVQCTSRWLTYKCTIV